MRHRLHRLPHTTRRGRPPKSLSESKPQLFSPCALYCAGTIFGIYHRKSAKGTTDYTEDLLQPGNKLVR